MNRTSRFLFTLLILSFATMLGSAKLRAESVVQQWVQRYNGLGNFDDSAYAVAVDGSGNVVVTGSSYNASNNPDYYTAKYAAADGALLWEKRYNGPANSFDYAQAVAVDGSGNVVVTGYSTGSGSGYDYYTAKYAAADGALLWEKRYNGPGNNSDYANAVAVDGSGNVVVTGSSNDSGGINSDYYTAKYAAADGALLWEKRYNGPGNNNDVAQAVAVDTSGNVIATGQSINGSNNGDFYTAKYAAADGALLWEKRYNGPGNSHDAARGVAVDGSGNVVVTGFAFGSGTGNDYYTAKYAAADGALLWEKRYNGPINADDLPSAVAMDASGNVVVTGYSTGSGSGYDYYTAKYAAADGALLWEKRYNGPANSGDYGGAVAVDGSGNVVVTGSSYNGSGNQDYYTAKYAAADGALIWEMRYDGPGHLFDSAARLALTPDGGAVVTGQSSNGSNYDYATVKYAPATPIPAVTLAATDGLTISTATLHGTVNPNGLATTAQFEYGLNTSYGRSASITLSPNDGATSQTVSANLTGLTPGTTYHYRLSATNSGGTNTTTDATFTTVSTNADLSSLALSSGTLSPAFASGTTSYTATVPYATTSVTVTPMAAQANATIKVNGATVASGSASGSIALAVGTNSISTVVTAQDGTTTKTYAVTVTRGAPSPGALDLAFNSGGTKPGTATTPIFATESGGALAVTVQADGKIIAAGNTNGGGYDRFALIRYNGDGTLDTGFGSGGKATMDFGIAAAGHGVALQSTGKIVVAGFTSSGNEDFALARCNTDGSLDLSFGTGGTGKITTPVGTANDEGYAMAVQPDDKIIVAGRAYASSASTFDFALVRYLPEGALDTSFGSGGKVTTDFSNSNNDFGQAVALQPDGKILVGGYSWNGTDWDFAVVRYNTNGSLDDGGVSDSTPGDSFGTGGKARFGFSSSSRDEAYAMAVQNDGKIVLAGRNKTGTNFDFALARLNSNGSPDTSFGASGTVITPMVTADDAVSGMALQSDGKIVVAGYSFNGSNYDFAVARYSINGSLDSTFGNSGKLATAIGSADDLAYAAAVQPGGGIIVAGYSHDGSGDHFALARYIGVAAAPAVTLAPADGITTNGATLHGTATPNGLAATAQFEYGLTTSYGSTANVTLSPNDGTAVQTVSSTLSGLAPGTTYHYRLTATNSIGTTTTSDATFTTTGAAPAVTVAPVSAITSSGATLNGTVNPNGVATTAQFEYGIDNTYGTTATVTLSPNDGTGAQSVSAATVELSPGTTFHYRLTATNSVGTSSTSDATFTTLSNNADLANLALSSGTLSPAFASGTTAYIANAPNGVSTITVTPTVADGTATVKVNGTSVVSGSATGPIGLAVGTNAIDVVVTAQDGTTKTYVVSITRAAGAGNLDASFGGSGSVITSFGNGRNDNANGVVVQSDGKVVVAGSSAIDGYPDFALVRYTTTGEIDPTFGVGGMVLTSFSDFSDAAESVALQNDGKIVAAGYADGALAIARYTSEGVLDTSFGGTGKILTRIGSSNAEARSVAVQADGKIVVAGYAFNGPATTVFALVRYFANGLIDQSFGFGGVVLTIVGDGFDNAHAVALQTDGKIVVAGNSDGLVALVRYSSNGSLDPTFNGNGIVKTDLSGGTGNNFGNGVVIQGDGRIIIAGSTAYGHKLALARYTTTGALDTTFNGSGIVTTDLRSSGDWINAAALQSNGKIVVCGYSDDANNKADFAVVRYTVDGALDTSFNDTGIAITPLSAGSDAAAAVAISADGKIVAAGSSYNGSDYDFAVTRYLGDPAPPAVTLASPDGVTISAATLHGTVNPNGLATAAHFEYGTDTAYGSIATVELVPDDGTTLQTVSATLTGLLPGTTYHYRLTATNSAGAVSTSDMTFTTLIGPTVTTEPITDLTPTSVILHATVNPNGSDTSAGFYVNGSYYPATPADIPAGNVPVAVSLTLSLLPGQNYVAFAYAQNAGGFGQGTAINFTAPGGPPIVTTEAVTDLTRTSVTLHGTVNPNLVETTAYFIVNGSYYAANPLTIPAGSAPVAISLDVPLESGRNYTARAFAQNAGGFDEGSDVDFTVVGDPVTTELLAKGGAVPAAGADPRIRAGGVWTGFGIPMINDSGIVSYLGKWSAPKTTLLPAESGTGIFVGDTLIAKATDAVPGISGATFKSFKDPVLAGDGSVAFLATITGPTGGSVTTANDLVLMTTAGGTLRVVAREGQEMPDAAGSQLKSITSAVIANGGQGTCVIFTGMLLTGPQGTAGPGGVTSANDSGAWRWDAGTGTLAQIIREGSILSGVSGSPVKTIQLLMTASGSPDSSRGQVAGDLVTFRAAFLDKTQAIIDSDLTGATKVLGSGELTVPGSPVAKWVSFGAVATPPSGSFAFVGSLMSKVGGVLSADAKRIFLYSAAGNGEVARLSQAAPGMESGAAFATFKDPVLAPGNDGICFLGTAKGGTVTTANDLGLWWRPANGALTLIAREGVQQPPGAPAGAQWKGFNSVGCTNSGPIFDASLLVGLQGAPGPGGVTGINDRGVWALDSTGTLQKLFEENDIIAGKTLKSFTTLSAASGSTGIQRGYNAAGTLVWRATFTDGSQALMRTLVP